MSGTDGWQGPEVHSVYVDEAAHFADTGELFDASAGLAVLTAAGLCVCCAAPATRMVAGVASACEACATGACERCIDADDTEEDDG